MYIYYIIVFYFMSCDRSLWLAYYVTAHISYVCNISKTKPNLHKTQVIITPQWFFYISFINYAQIDAKFTYFIFTVLFGNCVS